MPAMYLVLSCKKMIAQGTHEAEYFSQISDLIMRNANGTQFKWKKANGKLLMI